MEKVTEILFAEVVSESGERLGRVVDLRCPGEPEHGDSKDERVVGELLYAKSGFLELIGLRKANIKAVPWQSIKRIEPNTIVIKFLLVLTIILGLPAHGSANQATKDFILCGAVVDQAGAPIRGAEVSVYASPTLIAQTTTDSSGQFTFDKLKTNHGLLVVRASGFAELKREWTAKPGQTLQIVLALLPLREQVVITATRTPTKLGDAPSSITVVSSEELSTTAALRLDDALRQTTGFQLFRRSGSRTANPTSQGISLRGTGASGASRALMLVDGIPLNDPFGGWIYWGRVPRVSVDRVEVLRGGASHLYGGGALGGAVNVVTRTFSSPIFSMEASYGNQQTPDGSLFASITRQKWTLNMAAEISHTQGYVIVHPNERGRIDTPAGSRYSVVNPKLERQIAGIGSLFIRGEIFGESRTNGTPLQTNRTHLRQFSAGGDLQPKGLGDFNFRLYGGTQIFDQNFSAVASERASESLTRVQRVPSQNAGLTLQWSRPIGAVHTFAAGVEARELRGASDELAFVQNRPSFFVGAVGRERTMGLWAEDVIRINPRLIFSVGARIDRWREFSALSTTRPVNNAQQRAVQIFPDRKETAFSPQMSFLYAPSEKVSITGSITRAFRPPTLNELYRAFRVGDVVTLANENLRAERLTGGELGTRVYLLDQRLASRVTLFWAEITRPVANVTIGVTPNLITRQRQNLGRTRSRGLEFEAEARLSNRWSLSGGYLFADATVLEFPANRALEQLRIPQVPRHQGTFQMRYMNSSWMLGLQGRAGGNQFDDDQNRFPLDGYFMLDAFVARRLTQNLQVFAAAENVFNQRYKTGRTPVTTIGPPILVRFGLKFQLGASR